MEIMLGKKFGFAMSVLLVAVGVVFLQSCSSNTALGLKDANRPHIVFIAAEDEYNAAQTLPLFAHELQSKYNLDCKVLYGSEKRREGIVGLESLKKADLLVLYVRRRALPTEQMKYLRDWFDSGKPLVALRTSSHAFDTKGRVPAGCEDWRTFDHDVLGCNYHNHYKDEARTTVTVAAGIENHPILKGIHTPFESPSSLYMTSPLAQSATQLLIGSIPNREPEPVAWTNKYKNARIFYTSLGSIDDFDNEIFRKLLVNAVFWALDRPVSVQGGSAAKMGK
jgi:type 1 glutamine amidotransferase